jgi:hypothetical protein
LVQWNVTAISLERRFVRHLYVSHQELSVEPIVLAKHVGYITGQLYPAIHRNTIVILELALAKDFDINVFD